MCCAKAMKPSWEIFTVVCCLSFCVFTGCSHKKIEITSDYIINENWNRQNEKALANSITINKMKVKLDSIINPITELDQSELNKLEDDSSFIHYANIKIKEDDSYPNKKIYFNRDNGFSWLTESSNNTSIRSNTIGTLQKNNWYKFANLGTLSIRHIYVYVDSTNRIHRFDLYHSNY